MSKPGATRLDAVVIGGDLPDEFLGRHVREKMRLNVDGTTASFPYLRALARHDGQSEAAFADLTRQGLPFVSLNAPYLHQFLSGEGLVVETIPILTGNEQRLAAALAQSPRAIIISTTFLPLSEHIDRLAAKLKQLAPASLVVAGGTTGPIS